ncbi:hypothetical protein MKEN_01476700 [Mycena kentingensis (nom. inval.)]|nr:hypothetical protein MKEN_01476700 [Mycena kentingensis (nom. inval.)]
MGNHHENAEAIYASLSLSLYCAAIEWFLYGINLVLFFFCIYTLRRSRARALPHRCGLTLAVSSIFLFCTLHWILQLVSAGKLIAVRLAEAKHGDTHTHLAKNAEWNRINITMGVFYVTSIIVADGIFVFRCYEIWGRRKRVVVVPITTAVASAALGYASVIICGLRSLAQFLFINWIFPLAVVFSMLTNTMLMALTAGRIWWIARGAAMIMGPTVDRQYRTVVAMILESGALYVTPALLYLILYAAERASTQIIFATLAQIVGIAPTIIVVRVGLGSSITSPRDVEESVMDIRAPNSDASVDDKV